MVAITATSYATPSVQSQLGRAKLEQARREADQAESNAKVLRQEADQAEQDAQNGQARVSSVRQQVAQTDSTYANQLRQQVAASSSKQVQNSLRPVVAAAATRYTAPSNPLPSASPSASKLLAASQQPATVGQLVNQSA